MNPHTSTNPRDSSMRRRAVSTALLSFVAVSTTLGGAGAPAQAAASRALIQGSGSGWSSNAVNQWIADVQPNGLQVVYTASGSAQGRKDFGYKTTDFAVSDIGYQGTDKVTNDTDTSQGREFVYLPIVAGGTSFPYQVKVGGKLVRDLRLSGDTLVKIFTNQITNWNDPAVTADNNGRTLPSLQIIPVVHAEGSGATAQLTRYFDTAFAGSWRAYTGRSGFTEYFPRQAKQIAQNGSDGVMNYIASSAANGAIGYDEYSYALGKNYPVAKVKNTSGYFTLPTQFNVAVALTKAKINEDKASPDYLLQDLDSVYSDGDVRTYPLSSYSYGIIPTAAKDATMTTAKRQTLADYLYYSICQGQREVGPIGYSPLPINLVQASFSQIAKLKSADPSVDLNQRDVTTCNNPTFVPGQPNRNYLAETAPKPPACDKVGVGPCADGVTPIGASRTGTNPNAGTVGGNPSTGGSGAGVAGGGTPAPGAAAGGTTTGSGLAGGTVAGTGTVDPETGQVSGGAATAALGSDVAATPVDLANYSGAMTSALGGVALALLAGLIVAPPLLSRRLSGGQRP